jgi:hypothetical protein
MKRNISKIILLNCLTSLSFQTFAQQKSVAIKFDEFFYQKADLGSRANRFAQYIKKDLQSKFYIVYYNPRKSKYGLDGEKWADYAQEVLANGHDISQNRIILIDGGIRENQSLEFWIVPKGANPPKPIPHFDEKEAITCPEIRVAGEPFQFNKNEILKFSASTEGGESVNKTDYEWSISAGKIVEGQGTNQIRVDSTATDAKRITASVQIKGFAPECGNQAFATTEVGMFPYKFAEIEYNNSYLAALLDGMYIELINNSSLKGYVIIYGQRVGNSKEVLRSINTTKQYLQFRHFDMSRVSIVHGGFREEGAVEIYLIPAGIDLPKPTPTVDEKFVVFTDKIKKSRIKIQS